jgi:hypothetical protein
MDRFRYVGQTSAWLMDEQIRELRRSLALVDTAIDALRAYTKTKLGAAKRRSALDRRRLPGKTTRLSRQEPDEGYN